MLEWINFWGRKSKIGQEILSKEREQFPYTWVELPLEHLRIPSTGEPVALSILQNRTHPEKGAASQVHHELITKIKSMDSGIIVTSEFSYMNAHGPVSRKEFDYFVKEICSATKEKDILVISSFGVRDSENRTASVTIAIYNGDIVYSRKSGSNTQNKVFAVWGKKIGIETCIENGYTRGEDDKKLHDLDIIVNVACGLEFGTKPEEKPSMKSVKDNGYGIHVDGFGTTLHIVREKRDGITTTIHSSGLEILPDSDYQKYI